MNPLEDNLTSRHKRNKSSLMDSQTTSSPKRGSQVDDPLMSPVRSVPFMHTRNDSHTNITNVPHLNFSPRASQVNLASPYYDQPRSYQASRENFGEASPSKRASHTYYPSLTQDSPTKAPVEQTSLKRSPTKASSVYSTATKTSRTRSTTPSLPDSNWITHPSPSPSPSPPSEISHLRNKAAYQPLHQSSPFEYSSTVHDENLIPRPLEMHPPTPPPDQQKARQEARALTPSTGNAAITQGNWGPGMVGIGKARAWGGMGGGGRVVSRSGVEVRQGGIYPSGGVRAREVSGKVMEEGRGNDAIWR